MAIVINGQPTTLAPTPKKKSGHTRPRAPEISLDAPGRLRVAHLLALYALSHSALYARLRMKRIPPPDGRDPRPYWNTATIKHDLAA